MGQEEVSVMRKSFDDMCNLFLNENHEMDIQKSRKELIMKTNGKKRIFALLMCTMMIISSMSVWAAYASKTIGDPPAAEHALCELYLSSSKGQAFTTVYTNLLVPVVTSIAARNSSGAPKSDSGASVATVTGSNFKIATSTHQAGPYFGSLSV